MKLTATEVDRIFKDSLFRDEELVDGKPPVEPIIAEGIVSKFGFHPERLEGHRAEVVELLAQLPDGFNEETGGGWSFLMAAEDREGNQWGEHTNMEQLFTLGMGLGRVKCQLPRDMWSALPGGMPYYVITKE